MAAPFPGQGRRLVAHAYVLASLLLIGACAISACAPAPLRLPSGTGTPVPDVAALFERVTTPCRGIRTLTAEVALSGRAGERRLRGRLLAGFARPASIRLEAVAPFGPPAFILASQSDSTVLLFPRDDRVLRDASVADILEALAGISLDADTLRAVLTGCVAANPKPIGGIAYDGGSIAVELEGGATAYLRTDDRGARIVAARHGQLIIEYADVTNGLPRALRIRSADAQPVRADLTMSISQLETNTSLDPEVFNVDVPPDATPLTLEELRQAGPLAGS